MAKFRSRTKIFERTVLMLRVFRLSEFKDRVDLEILLLFISIVLSIMIKNVYVLFLSLIQCYGMSVACSAGVNEMLFIFYV